jgi:hypothetical protein
MKKRVRSLALFLTLSFVFGCQNNTHSNHINFDLIASEKRLPKKFNTIVFKGQYLVKKAVHQSEFEKIWNLYAFENKAPNINFIENDVYFIGVLESGSCPLKIKAIDQKSNNKVITVMLSKRNGACTADATPRTIVIQVDKVKSQDIENIVIVQNGAETSVSLEN